MKRLLVTACCLLSCSSLFAQKVGDTIVVSAERTANLKSGSDIVGTVGRGNHLRVDQVNGDRFLVKYKGTQGWINRSDVIHIDEAIDFFTNAIRRNPTARDYACRGVAWSNKGEFDAAIKWQEKALEMSLPKSKAELQAHLELYKSGKPFRE